MRIETASYWCLEEYTSMMPQVIKDVDEEQRWGRERLLHLCHFEHSMSKIRPG